MCPVLRSPFHSLRPDFARVISRKFEQGRFLVIGADSAKLERQFAETGREAVALECSGDLPTKLRHEDGAAHFEIAVWFYPPEKSDDNRLAEELSRRAGNIALMPGAGVDGTKRRPERAGAGNDMPSAPARRKFRHANSSSGNGSCEAQHAADRSAADAPNPGV